MRFGWFIFIKILPREDKVLCKSQALCYPAMHNHNSAICIAEYMIVRRELIN